MPAYKLHIVAALVSVAALAGCQEEDTGTCCRSLSADAASAIPRPEAPDGGLPRDLVATHPAFDCSALTCVSYKGSEAFCTRKCKGENDCPEGFKCVQVLQADPGPMAPVQPTDTFCVRNECESDGQCPEDFKCIEVYKTTPSPPDEPIMIRQCRRPDHACN